MLPILWWICSRYHKIWWPMYMAWNMMWVRYITCIDGKRGRKSQEMERLLRQLQKMHGNGSVKNVHITSFEPSSIGLWLFQNCIFYSNCSHSPNQQWGKRYAYETSPRNMQRIGQINRYRPNFADKYFYHRLSPISLFALFQPIANCHVFCFECF